jgi:DNA-binding MarR family transcriptional regulator
MATVKAAAPSRERMRVTAREGDYPTQEAIGLLMRIALRGLRSAFKERLARDRIPWSVWYCLRVLWEHEGLTQRELTDRVGLMQPNTVNALRLMQKRRLVVIEREAADRRKLRIYLTREAKQLKARLLPDMRNVIEAIALKGFSPAEKTTLQSLLNKMCENIETHARAGGAAKS